MCSIPAGATNLSVLLEANKEWANNIAATDPTLFEEMAAGQSPKLLWISCSDSRVVPNSMCQLPPGEMFVHRNIANVVASGDLNLLAILQYAVEVLKIEHIVVCGHYQCGGVNAAMGNKSYGLIDNWLMHIRGVAHTHRKRLAAVSDPVQRAALLVELNVANSVFNLAHTPIVQSAWQSGQKLAIHGWVFSLQNGKIDDLGLIIDGMEKIDAEFQLKSGAKGDH
ncbi:carbonic anhydrase [Blastocladiella britannica]|nr:carbonic anhydrase [Blastocladiella britannica]